MASSVAQLSLSEWPLTVLNGSVEPGDIVCYPARSGNTAEMRYGVVTGAEWRKGTGYQTGPVVRLKVRVHRYTVYGKARNLQPGDAKIHGTEHLERVVLVAQGRPF